MGLFTPKITKNQVAQIKGLLKQADESAKLVNETLKPDIFFKRLNFFLDTLLALKQFEKYKVMKGTPPSKTYSETIRDMDKTVNKFIDRSYADAKARAALLQTEKSRNNKIDKYFEKMLAAFENSNTYWQGSSGPYPHYTGPLYTPSNHQYLLKLAADFESNLMSQVAKPTKVSSAKTCADCGELMPSVNKVCTACGSLQK